MAPFVFETTLWFGTISELLTIGGWAMGILTFLHVKNQEWREYVLSWLIGESVAA